MLKIPHKKISFSRAKNWVRQVRQICRTQNLPDFFANKTTRYSRATQSWAKKLFARLKVLLHKGLQSLKLCARRGYINIHTQVYNTPGIYIAYPCYFCVNDLISFFNHTFTNQLEDHYV